MGGIETAAVHSNNQSNSLLAWRAVPPVVTSKPNFCSPPSSILSSFGRMTAETRPFCDFSVFMLFKGIFGKLSKPFLSHRHFSSTFPQARLPLKSSRKVASIVKYTYFQVSWTQNQQFKEVIAVLRPVLMILKLFGAVQLFWNSSYLRKLALHSVHAFRLGVFAWQGTM